MGFVQISKEAAERFAEFILESGGWANCSTGLWEAYRFRKIRKIDPSEPCYSPLDTIVIHRSKKGIHSFDPLHLKAYEYSTLGLSPPLEAPAERRTDMGDFLGRLKKTLAGFSKDYRIETVDAQKDEILVTFAVPVVSPSDKGSGDECR
jgi:hypothetical protein